jgi:hypothetical protein
MVNVFAKAPKINALKALQDVRLGRDTGEAWSGPAPWEEADAKKANQKEKRPYDERIPPDDTEELMREIGLG